MHRIDPWVLRVWPGDGLSRRRPLVFTHSVHELAVIPSANHYTITVSQWCLGICEVCNVGCCLDDACVCP